MYVCMYVCMYMAGVVQLVSWTHKLVCVYSYVCRYLITPASILDATSVCMYVCVGFFF